MFALINLLQKGRPLIMRYQQLAENAKQAAYLFASTATSRTPPWLVSG
jgi:hypothetical protein